MDNVYPTFPSLVFHANIPVPDTLPSYCLKMSKGEGLSRFRSNRGGWHSKEGLQGDEYFAKTYFNNFIQRLSNATSIPPFRVASCWIMVNRKGDYNVSHDHPTNHYSLVWYIQTPPNSGLLVLENPNAFAEHAFLQSLPSNLRKRFNTGSLISFQPKEGDFYLFPSYLRHSVDPNESRRARIALSANLLFKNDDHS